MKNNLNKKSSIANNSLLLLAAIINLNAAGLAGWYVWHSRQTSYNAATQASESGSSAQQKLHTDTANVFSLTYPGDWKQFYDNNQSGGEGNRPAVNWSKQSRPLLL